MKFILCFVLCLAVTAPLSARAEQVQALKTALQLVKSEEWDSALAVAPQGIGRDLVLWAKLREGQGKLGDYEDFLARRDDWPGLPLLQEKGETAVARSTTPSRIIAYFKNQPPRTARGAIALVGAYRALGQIAQAETEAMRAWAELKLTAEDEASLIALMPEAIAAVNDLRLENLLWDGRRAEAQRMLPLVSDTKRKLAQARLALRAGQPGSDQVLAAVPQDLAKHPGLLYERFIWRMKRDLYPEAAELLLSVAPDALGRPEEWAPRRLLLARWMMRQGKFSESYRIAAQHGLETGARFVDLEFLAGFIALRKLNDPDTALKHFARLRAEVSTAISVARGEYWQGRAEEAAGRKSAAEAHYRKAAAHQTTYYGLLAAERLGLSLDPKLLDETPATGWETASFVKSSVWAAGRLLLSAGDREQADRFFLHLSESLNTTELAQLAEMTLELGETHFALVIAKKAAERGAILPRPYFPVSSMVPDGLKVSRALAMAIARRESEFDPVARSGANARGLMQVLPETAERMARDLGLDYATSKLYQPAFNTQVGSAYLAKMMEEFGPSIALIASGYNAGPGRPRRWITELGDPRQANVDVVDWVETIPIAETRTYVMRVVEGVVIYRAKLRGSPGPIRITSELRG